MTAADPSGAEAPDMPGERDALGWFCFVHHLAVMVYIVVGWLFPWKAALVFYVAFLPAVVVQWRFNKDSCIFNNVESLLRTGQWRDPANREEGAWLLTLARETLRLPVTPLQVDILTYAIMVLLWLLGFGHMLRL